MSPSTQGKWQDLNAGNLGLSDAAGWSQPQYYETLRLADTNGDGQAELLIRGSAGLLTYAFNQTIGQWQNINAGTLGLTDAGSWNLPQYYRTLRLADIDGNGQAELLLRAADGLHSFAFNRASQQWQDINAPIAGMNDANGWNQPQYYETLQLADVNGDGREELIFRGPYGLFTYAFDPASKQWYDLNAGDLGLTDAGGWNLPQYYRTLRLADIDGDGQAELLLRGADGLHTFAFNKASQRWQDINAPIAGMNDANGWNQPQYYQTLGLADMNADGREELIFRGPYGLFTYAFDPVSKQWYDLNAGDLGMTDSANWNQPQYYTTYRLADINADGQAELLVRGSAGLLAYVFDQTSGKWVGLQIDTLGLSDTTGWANTQYYSTIQTADINGDGQSELIARSAMGIDAWHYNPSRLDIPVLFQAPHYELSYRFDPDPSLPKGTFAVAHVIPAGDASTFTCTLININGRKVFQSAATAAAAVSAPSSLAVLPGRFLTVRLNRQGSNSPDLVIRMQVPEELAAQLNQQRITFIWSVVPAVWPVLATSLNYDVSLDFDGTSSFVDIGNPDDLQFTGQITLQAWLKPTANDGLRNVIAHGYTMTPDGEVYLRIADGRYEVGSWNGKDHVATYPMPVSDLGRWVYLSGVYDGARWTLYRNSQAVASSADSTGAIRVTAPWAIGARGGGSERFFSGSLRNIALWKTARTAQQIQADMIQPPTENVPGLAAYWGLSEGSGNAGDLGPNAHLATVTKARWVVPSGLLQLLTLPTTSFPALTPTQVPAYQYISSQLDATSHEDIRSLYVNLNLDTSRMISTLQSLAMPQGASYSLADWNATKYILAQELQAVGQVQTFYRQKQDLLNVLQLEQTEDLNAVISNLQNISPAPPASDSWTGIIITIMSDALGLLSDVPDAKVAQIALLAGSDLFAALMPGSSSANQPAPPNSAGLQASILSAYQSLVNLNGEQTKRVLQDGILLPIVARLARTIWIWQTSDQEHLVTQIRTPTKVGFYQMLIPQSYVISEWVNYPANEPVLFVQYQETPVGAPVYAYWAQSNGVLYNLYIIHTPGNSNGDTSWNGVPGYEHPINPALYPAQAVMDDLFNQLGVSRETFFTCSNGWGNISLMSISLPGT